MARPLDDEVDMTRIQFQSYAFHFFFAAGKGCLMPFLPIYFRFLGLTAWQTGLAVGVKSFVGMVTAPCWTRCATGCSKKRFVLMFSIFVLLMSYMMMILIPPVDPAGALRSCGKPSLKGDGNGSAPMGVNGKANITDILSKLTSTKSSSPAPVPSSPATTPLMMFSSTTTTPERKEEKEEEEEGADEFENAISSTTTVARIWEEDNAAVASPDTIFADLSPEEEQVLEAFGITRESFDDMSAAEVTDYIQELIDNIKVNMPGENADENSNGKAGRRGRPGRFERSLRKADTRKPIDTEEDQDNADPDFVNDLNEGNMADSSDEGEEEMKISSVVENPEKSVKATKEEAAANTNADKNDTPSNSELLRAMFANFAGSLSSLKDQLVELKKQLFATILVVLIASELFSSPTEKLADDLWFEFLDGMDMLERYGQHRTWGALGLILFPVLATVAVYYSPCMLPSDTPRIQIHFFFFAALISIAFVLGFFYPIFREDHKKVVRRNKLYRGIRVLCSDCQGLIFAFSIFLLGLLSACLYTFLFWLLEDGGGTELLMGGSVAVAAFSEMIMTIAQKALIRRISSPGAVVLGFLVLGARFVVYSFLWTPWVVLAGEAFHGMSFSLIWGAVHTYPDFRLNPFVMDRSALAVINAVYMGLGFATGCILAGFVYDNFGITILYQGASVVCGAWCIVFPILYKCVKKKEKVRYAKLLQEEEAYTDDESASFEDDDWLEVALKHQK